MKSLVINKEDLKHNIKRIKEIAEETGKDDNNKTIKVIAVVKGNGYGLGLVQYTKFLIDNGIDFFAVSTVEEAIDLRKAGIKEKIIMLSSTAVIEDVRILIENNIILSIGSREAGDIANDIGKELNKKVEVDAIVPRVVTQKVKNRLLDENVNGICISPETEELGIYKSFNYEIFERRKSIVIAFDGNSPVLNLVQEAKNGKGKSKIYVNQGNQLLREKADTLEGYVTRFNENENLSDIILKYNPEIFNK